jgi:VIT1/CCC1 family predicted Fe2+/Mn2+ transporter
MKDSTKKGFAFGLTSAVITTLGLVVGLHSSTHSVLVVVGGVLVIAISDAMSDALGVHISEEAELSHSKKEIWEATISTFLSKFIFALTFVAPFFLFGLSTAIIVDIIWGLSLICLFSIYVGKNQETKTWKVVAEHLFIAIVVIVITHYVGSWTSTFT